MIRMWEGQVQQGIPNGFIRIIDGDQDYNFVGYSEGWNSRYGTGLYFKNDELSEAGYYMGKSDNRYTYTQKYKSEHEYTSKEYLDARVVGEV